MDIETHLKTSHISIDRYVKQQQVVLGQSLEGRFPLYLDLNYWIALRNADAGKGNEYAEELLRLLRELTSAEQLFCPISESVFIELMKQSDVQSRLRTARLIDDLSTGVALVAADMRAATELRYLIHSHVHPPAALHPLRHLVWTKASFALGVAHPSLSGLDAETQLAMQKSFFDTMWMMSLSDLIKSAGTPPLSEKHSLSALAEKLNSGNATHADEIRSFAQAYAAETRGVASLVADEAMMISQDLGEVVPLRGSDDWLRHTKMWENLIYHALQEEHRTKLPSLHVQACLHAAYRWDKSLRFEANDFYDFHHASAALAYCRAFFTERSLKFHLTSKQLALDSLYQCDVVSGLPEAVAYLRARNWKDAEHGGTTQNP